MEEAFQKQIDTMRQLDEALDKLDESIDVLNKDDNNAYEEINKRCDAKTKAKLNWAGSFGVYTLYYLWLKMNEIDPKMHPIKKEISRLQEFRERINNAINPLIDNEDNRKAAVINKEATKRTVSNYLGIKRKNVPEHVPIKEKKVKK